MTGLGQVGGASQEDTALRRLRDSDRWGTPMREDRFEKLGQFLLHDVKLENFDVGVWGLRGFQSGACGTAACALGWATVCFPSDGLRMVFPKPSEPLGSVIYDGETGFEAAARFFEVPFEHAFRLFSTPGSSEAVAQRLLDYVADPDGTYRSLVS